MRSLVMLLACGLVSAQTVQQWENSKKFTLEVAEKMPADKYGFKATDAEMTFGELMFHLAGSQAFRFQQISAIKPPPGLLRAPSAKPGKDEILAMLRDSFDFVMSIVPRLTAEQLDRVYKVGWRDKPEATGREINLAMLVHTAHHRAQAEVYLRLNGIVPPAYLF